MITFLIALFLYAWFVEPYFIVIRRTTVSVPALKAPLRILFISDLHIGRFNSTGLLRSKIARLAKVHKKEPFDVVLVGGDLIDWEARYLPIAAEIMGSLVAFGVPVYVVPGNHDYFDFKDMSEVRRVLKEKGAQLLLGESVTFSDKSGDLLLVGLDDLEQSKEYRHNDHEFPSRTTYRARASKLDLYARFDQEKPELPRIILSHNPDTIYLPSTKPASLVLTGHTHGGQMFPLRYVGPLLARFMPQGSFICWSGIQKIGGTTHIVSRGLQGSLFPLRFLCPSEAHSITLQP